MEKKLIKGHESVALTEKQREKLINKAGKQFGKFLTTLGYDWENDPHMKGTPHRYTKAWVNELFGGNFRPDPKVTSFAETDETLKGEGIIIDKDIEIISKCSHHLETFKGVAHVGYFPAPDGTVIGLSKINRICDFVARRPQVQERLTKQILDELNAAIPGNQGIIVYVDCGHQCCSNRGIGHNSSMVTIEASGMFRENSSVKQEFLFAISNRRKDI